METRLRAAERYGVLGNAQGEVGGLVVRKGKGLALSASDHGGSGEVKQRQCRERGRRAWLGDRLGRAVVN